jgi:hypothetical protein
MAEDTEEISGLPVFRVGGRVRALAAMAPGFLPRLATGCGEAIVKAYNPHTRDGLEEMFSRGCARSSEGAKAAGEAKRRVAELEKEVERAVK